MKDFNITNFKNNIFLVFKILFSIISVVSGVLLIVVSFNFNVWLFESMFDNNYTIIGLSLGVVIGEITAWYIAKTNIKQRKIKKSILSVIMFLIPFIINISASTAYMINKENIIQNKSIINSEEYKKQNENNKVMNDFISNVSNQIKNNKYEVTDKDINDDIRVKNQLKIVNSYDPIKYKTRRNKALIELNKIKNIVKKELELKFQNTNVSNETIQQIASLINKQTQVNTTKKEVPQINTTDGLNGFILKITTIFNKNLPEEKYNKLSFFISIFLGVGIELIMTHLTTVPFEFFNKEKENNENNKKKETKIVKKENNNKKIIQNINESKQFSLDEYLNTKKNKEMKVGDIVKEIKDKYNYEIKNRKLGKLLVSKNVEYKIKNGYRFYKI